MTPAASTEPQYMIALARANKVRFARADTKRWIAAASSRQEGIRRAMAILDELPEHMQTCPLDVFLLSISYFGKKTVRKLLGERGFPEQKPLGSLTDRQIMLLKAELHGYLGRG